MQKLDGIDTLECDPIFFLRLWAATRKKCGAAYGRTPSPDGARRTRPLIGCCLPDDQSGIP